jgi:CHAT domain
MADQPLTYCDLNIEMTDLKDDGAFKVRVIGEAPNGRTMRGDQVETSAYKSDDFRRLLGKLNNRSATQDELKQLGKQLADLMLPGMVRTIFDESLYALEKKGKGLRVRLSIEPLKLSALPWEYALVPRTPGEMVANDFLAWRRNVSLTRYENLGSALGPLTGKAKLRIVAALASPLPDPGNPNKFPELNLAADEQAINAAIDYLKSRTQAVESKVLRHTTREALLEAIKDADIFHFAGHGLFDGAELTPAGEFRKRGEIVLETEANDADPYPSDQLASALGDAGVRLAVLGACNSASRDEGGAWTGVAPALVREKLPAVVAMQYRLADATAAAFMPFLYTFALKGYTIDESVFEGRRAIFGTVANWAEGGRDWGVPVLYLLAKDGNLFPMPPAEAVAAGATQSPLVELNQDIDTVEGEVIGAKITKFLQTNVNVYQKIKLVGKGGVLIGLEL